MFKINFNKHKNIYLDADEVVTIINSLNSYKEQLEELINNRPKVSNDKILYVCLNGYFNMVDIIKEKFEKTLKN